MNLLAFLRDNARWLAAGFLMALGSSFGQTFFIALFSEPLRETFELSHGAFGAIYMLGTCASALALIQFGGLVDRVSPRRLSAAVAAGLGAVCAAMAAVDHWLLLLLAIFGLRLMGQGMLSHISQTVMARWFVATRGRAIAIAAFGYPTGEALAPLFAVALIGAIGWRETWLVAGALSAFALGPALWRLLARERAPQGDLSGFEVDRSAGLDGRHATRGEVVRGGLFWMLLPGLAAPGFIITVVFFLPSHIAETKGWAFEALPSRYWIYALLSVIASLAAGWAADRFGARRCLALYQTPMAAGLLALAFGTEVWTASLAMALIGATAGAAATIHAAIWAEIYGSRHLGAIKALGHSVMVFSTAAGPGLVGAAIDLGAPFPVQAAWLAGYALLVSLGFAWIVAFGPMARMGAAE